MKTKKNMFVKKNKKNTLSHSNHICCLKNFIFKICKCREISVKCDRTYPSLDRKFPEASFQDV